MSKAAQIRALAQSGKSIGEIAQAVLGMPRDATGDERDCKLAYVRVVLRQRLHKGKSPADLKYLKRSRAT